MRFIYPKPHMVQEKVYRVQQGDSPYYYSIDYYDVFRGKMMNGYGSFDKEQVAKYLREEFVTISRLDLKEHTGIDLFGEKTID